MKKQLITLLLSLVFLSSVSGQEEGYCKCGYDYCLECFKPFPPPEPVKPETIYFYIPTLHRATRYFGMTFDEHLRTFMVVPLHNVLPDTILST